MGSTGLGSWLVPLVEPDRVALMHQGTLAGLANSAQV